MNSKILNIAHRGASAFLPDNTIESFEQAVAENADMLELDVRRTADGELVLFHDWFVKTNRNDYKGVSLDRLVSHTCLNDLRELSDKKGIRLATLDEVLERFRGRIGLDIELKEGGYEYEIIDLVRKYELENRVILSSFLPWVIKKIKDIDNRIKTGWIVGQERILKFNILARPLIGYIMKMIEADSAHLHYVIVTPKLIMNLKARNIPVYVWTVDDVDAMNRLIKMGVGGIITNRPGQLCSILSGKPVAEEVILMTSSRLTMAGDKA